MIDKNLAVKYRRPAFGPARTKFAEGWQAKETDN
jgi:hypothetical protein